MKRQLLIFGLMFFTLFFSGCKKEEKTQELAQGVFIKLSTETIGQMDSYKMCRYNIEVDQSGKVTFFADNFYEWLGDEPCPVVETRITTDELTELKRLIEENKIYNMREDIGNKDIKEGDNLQLTVYTNKGEHVTGGFNPSNRAFLTVYDYIMNCVREEFYSYKLQVMNIQSSSIIPTSERGIKIRDDNQAEFLNNNMIAGMSVVYVDEVGNVYPTGIDENATYPEDSNNFRVVIYFDDEGTMLINNKTMGLSEEVTETYYLYINGTYETTIFVDGNISDGQLMIVNSFTEDAAYEYMEYLENSTHY